MPVSKKRRRNGKLLKRTYQHVMLNRKKEQLEELEELRTDQKRLNKIEKLSTSIVKQKGNASKEAGKCAARFEAYWEYIEEKHQYILHLGKEIKKDLTVVSSIMIQRTRDKVRVIKHKVKKISFSFDSRMLSLDLNARYVRAMNSLYPQKVLKPAIEG